MSENIFDKIIITELREVFTNNYPESRKLTINNRVSCGIMLAISGKIIYKHGSIKYISDNRHALFLPKGCSYSLNCIASGSFTVLNFDAENYPKDIVCFDINDLSELLHLQTKLEQLKITIPLKKLSAISHIYGMLSILSEKSTDGMLPSVVMKSVEYIVNNHKNALTCADIANQVGISPVYLRKLFSRHLNMPVMRYVRFCRIKHAMLLSGSQLTVNEIAAEVGYADAPTFNKAFKRMIGCTPIEYRRKSI